MLLNDIVDAINRKLAGEMFTFDELKVWLDEAIDDINSDLNACFPTFSEFSNPGYKIEENPDVIGPIVRNLDGTEITKTVDSLILKPYLQYPDYNFFPDKYIRSVVIPGVCAKFYTTDEEGAQVAQQYQWDYKDNRFLMIRDYSANVPIEWRDRHQGFLHNSPNFLNSTPEVYSTDFLL